MSAGTFTNWPKTRIAALCRIEDEIRGRSADERRAIRQQRTRPLLDALQPWLREKLSLISQKTKLADAIRYALSRWTGLSLFLDDGRIEIDITSSSEPFTRWPSIAKTRCSPARMAAPSTGRSSPR